MTTIAAIEHAAATARAAFDATVTPPDAAALLSALAAAVSDASAELVTLADAETALGATRLRGEVARTAFQLRAFADLAGSAALLDPVIDTADPGRVPPRAEQRSIQIPLGPVAVFAASNFPFAFGVLGGDTASALAAGCPVVVEAHPAQPATSAALGRIVTGALAAAGVLAAWLQVVQGAGAEAATALVRHPGIAAVGFTGSFTGGTALVRAAADRPIPIPVYAEMGSLNPVFVSPGAAGRKAAELATAWVATLVTNAGQLCTKPGLLVLPGPESAAVVEAAVRSALDAAEVPPMLAPRLRGRCGAPGGRDRRGRRGAAARQRRIGRSRRREPRGQLAAGGGRLRGRRDGAGPSDAARGGVRPGRRRRGRSRSPAGTRTGGRHPGLTEPPDCTSTTAPVAAQLLVRLLVWLVVRLGSASGGGDDEWATHALRILRPKAGRLLVDGWPTGVSVGWATVHGGPWPATSAPASTSVGLGAARRFTRPVAYQGVPDRLLPGGAAGRQPAGPAAAPRRRSHRRAGQGRLMGSGTAHTERLALAATLAGTDPAAPTLCTGWDASMLAAHLVLRDRRPDLQVGMLVKPLGERLATAQGQLAGSTWPDLVEKVREGPRWSLSSITVVDDLMNTLEFAVHHEDVRRAQPGWEPRDLPAAVSQGLWRSLGTVGKFSMRSAKVPLVFALPTGERAVMRKGPEPVVVTGPALELALFTTGRRQVARVELVGSPAAVSTVRETETGM